MGNDWRIWAEKAGKGIVISAGAIIASIVMQLDAQCPGATITIGGTTLAFKLIADVILNAVKHAD